MMDHQQIKRIAVSMEKAAELLKEMEKAVEKMGRILEDWQYATDMMSFIIGEANTALLIYVDNRPVEEAKVTVEREPELHMRFEGKWMSMELAEDTKEVPLFLGDSNDPNRVEIGTAKVRTDGTIDAIVNHEAAGFLPLPDPSEYSFFTDQEALPQKKWWAARVTLPNSFRDDAMNRRCTECEHLVRQCICKKEN